MRRLVAAAAVSGAVAAAGLAVAPSASAAAPPDVSAAVAGTDAAMRSAIETNAAITQLTIQFQTAMQGINSIREAWTEAYKKAGEANQSMHQ